MKEIVFGESALAYVFEKVNEVMLLLSENQKIIHLNQAALQYFDLDKSQLGQLFLSELFPQNTVESWENWQAKDVRSPLTFAFEKHMPLTFEASRLPHSSFYILIGKKEEAAFIPEEETEKLLKLLEQDLNLDGQHLDRLLAGQKINKLKLISENTLDVVCLHHPADARYLYASPSTEKIMGYTSRDLMGKVPYDFIHPDHLVKLSKNLTDSKEGLPTFPEKLELLFRVKNNTYQWFEGYSKPIYNKKEEVILILSCTRNIQDRKIAEMEKKERELIQQHLLSSSILLEKKKTIMEKLESKVLELEPQIRKEIRSVLTYIREVLKFDDDWEDFMIHFKNIHPDFYENILTQYPHLSKNDLQHLAFLKLGLTSAEIAKITVIKKASLRVVRNRLKKKLALNESQDLLKFIQEF
ncbi:PAS domain-containing protein [Rapidithrix thailandica]|uniref:PAS domain-containing protein n=1 Tax=Rapidithrix thailandica TaxID=413964 RepID=A0AAW9SC93_9BACT